MVLCLRFSKGGNQCPICLEPITADAFLDLYKFCYHCILQRSEVLSNQQHKAFSHLPYPLCKMQDTSIIHNFIGPVFQCHYVSKLPAKSFDLSEATRTTIVNAAAGMVSSLISGVYFVPLDVVRQDKISCYWSNSFFCSVRLAASYSCCKDKNSGFWSWVCSNKWSSCFQKYIEE